MTLTLCAYRGAGKEDLINHGALCNRPKAPKGQIDRSGDRRHACGLQSAARRRSQFRVLLDQLKLGALSVAEGNFVAGDSKWIFREWPKMHASVDHVFLRIKLDV